MKVYIRNQQRSTRINQQRIRRLLRRALNLLGLQKSELSILFVNDRRMRILNLRYRGIDRTTDVLSFPQLSADEQQTARAEAKTSSLQCFRASELLLGDIVINLPKAKRQANEYGLTLSEELRRLIVHGLLTLSAMIMKRAGIRKGKWS
jgi:probable rRNA maturation factor